MEMTAPNPNPTATQCTPIGLLLDEIHRSPQMAGVLARKILVDAGNHAAPPTSFDQSEHGNQELAEPD